MIQDVYIQLLNEGIRVYRPVPATHINGNIFKLGGDEFYDPEDEQWEFLPGSIILVEEQNLDGEIVLVAIKQLTNTKESSN